MKHDIHQMSEQAVHEIGMALAALEAGTAETFCNTILTANRIACYGCGREGLMLRGLCMRMMHLGLDAHMVGDMTTPPVGPGDLLIVTSGPGNLNTGNALLRVAKEAGATTLVITAQPSGPTPSMADVMIHLPAQTMANDQGETVSLLPMGSLFEAAELVFFDLISIMLREKSGETPETMRARHTNLE